MMKQVSSRYGDAVRNCIKRRSKSLVLPILYFDFGFNDERKRMATFLKKYQGRVFVFEAETGRKIALTLTTHTTSRGTYWYVERSVVE